MTRYYIRKRAYSKDNWLLYTTTFKHPMCLCEGDILTLRIQKNEDVTMGDMTSMTEDYKRMINELVEYIEIEIDIR